MTITSEEWRPVEDFVEFYEVSCLGRVRSLDKTVFNGKGYAVKKGKLLSQHVHPKTGYCKVCLWDKCKPTMFLTHRLVAKAFPEICGEYFDKAEVDHINTIRTDNRAENLRWVTRHENHMNPITRTRNSEIRKGKEKKQPVWNKGKKFPQYSGKDSVRSKPILQYSINGVLIKIWDNTRVASDTLKITRTAITNCLTGRTKTSSNYIWKYKEEE